MIMWKNKIFLKGFLLGGFLAAALVTASLSVVHYFNHKENNYQVSNYYEWRGLASSKSLDEVDDLIQKGNLFLETAVKATVQDDEAQNFLPQDHFDVEKMARSSAGKYFRKFKKLGKGKKEQYVNEVFPEKLMKYLTTLREELQNHVGDGEVQFKPTKASEVSNSTAISYDVSISGGEPVKVMLEFSKKSKMIFDVKVEGLSLSSVINGSVQGQIKKSGLESLFE